MDIFSYVALEDSIPANHGAPALRGPQRYGTCRYLSDRGSGTGSLLDCGEMQRLSADEIASTLLARLLREVENFSASRPIDDDAKAEEIWRRFVKYLKDGKPSTPRVAKGSKKTTPTKGRSSIQ
jgi:hypothetical protein